MFRVCVPMRVSGWSSQHQAALGAFGTDGSSDALYGGVIGLGTFHSLIGQATNLDSFSVDIKMVGRALRLCLVCDGESRWLRVASLASRICTDVVFKMIR